MIWRTTLKTIFAAILASSMLAAAVPALGQAQLDFTLVNRTGYTISEVYVSPLSSDDWEEDIMGADQLEDGDRVEIQFTQGAKGCKWDLMVTYDDEEEAKWQGFDLCETSVIELHYDRNKGTTWAEYE